MAVYLAPSQSNWLANSYELHSENTDKIMQRNAGSLLEAICEIVRPLTVVGFLGVSKLTIPNYLRQRRIHKCHLRWTRRCVKTK